MDIFPAVERGKQRPSRFEKAAKLLDEDHYGLAKIKERILEYLAVRILAPEAKAPIIALWDRPVSVRPALPALLPVRWIKIRPYFSGRYP